MTASVYIFSSEKVLLIFHPKIHKWLPPGGHLEEGELPHEGAQREVLEETGLDITWRLQENITINRWNAKSIPRPYLCLLESVEDAKGPHKHIDFIFIADALESQVFKNPETQEAQTYLSGIQQGTLKWFTLEEILALKGDKDIFIETQETLEHLMKKPSLTSLNS